MGYEPVYKSKNKIKPDDIPTKEEVLRVIAIPERERNIEDERILMKLSSHPNWSGSSVCRCPTCGYMSTVTNIHRNCPETPATARLTARRFCFTHNTNHFIEDKEKGMKIWTEHESVPMYVVE